MNALSESLRPDYTVWIKLGDFSLKIINIPTLGHPEAGQEVKLEQGFGPGKRQFSHCEFKGNWGPGFQGREKSGYSCRV